MAASLALWVGLISHDFNIEYVAAYTARNLPAYYIVSAFWAGQKGSLLFWAVVLALFGSLAQALTARRYAPLLPYVAGVTSAVVVFFVSVMLPEDANTQDLVNRANDANLVLTPGAAFFADPDDGGATEGDRFVRLPFCAVTPDQIEEGVKRLAGLL